MFDYELVLVHFDYTLVYLILYFTSVITILVFITEDILHMTLSAPCIGDFTMYLEMPPCSFRH